MPQTKTTPAPRSLSAIAREIQSDWNKVHYAAAPYLQAMFSLRRVDDDYGSHSGRSVVRYFLGNAGSWRGDTARRVKAELRAMIK